MAKRGRPSNKTFAEHITDEVAATMWKEQARVKWGLAKAKGQQQIGVPFIKGVCERVAKKYGIQARTVETYYYRHQPGIVKRYSDEIVRRLRGKRVRNIDQSAKKVFRRK